MNCCVGLIGASLLRSGSTSSFHDDPLQHALGERIRGLPEQAGLSQEDRIFSASSAADRGGPSDHSPYPSPNLFSVQTPGVSSRPWTG